MHLLVPSVNIAHWKRSSPFKMGTWTTVTTVRWLLFSPDQKFQHTLYFCKNSNRRKPFKSTSKNPLPAPWELYCFPQWLLSCTSTTNFRIPNDHLSPLPRYQKWNAKHEENILSASMVSRALLLKQLSVMHQVWNTNTSRSCVVSCLLKAAFPGTQAKPPLLLPCFQAVSLFVPGSQEKARRREFWTSETCAVHRTQKVKRKINGTVVQPAGKISLSVPHCKHAPCHS